MNRGFLLLRLVSLALLGFTLTSSALVPNPVTVAPVAPPAPPRAIPYTDVNPLGANFFLDREVETWKKEQTLKMAQEAGIGWAKILFSWEGIEPRRGQFFDDRLRISVWDKYDEMVSLAEKYGLRIIARLDRTPYWARPDNSLPNTPPNNFEDYGDFINAVVTRYRGRVQFYQVWNEPNIYPEWGDQPVNAAQYVQMLKVASRRAKEADPNAVILSAPLAQTLERSPRNVSDLDYLEAMYQAGARDAFDILFANGYGFDRPPEDPPGPTVLNFRRVELIRGIMEQHGDTAKPIWLNEFGWNASPPDFPPDKLSWQRVTEEQQADYTARAYRLAASWPWMGVINLWYFRQVGDIGTDRSDYFFRVVDPDFTPRLVYASLEEVAKSYQAAPPGLHQETTAAVHTQGHWSYLRDAEASGQGLIAADTPGVKLNLTFEGTGLRLFAPTGPDRGQALVTVDGQAPRGPPRDNSGRAYLDLYASAPREGASFVVAQGLRPGRHTLELTVDDRRNAAAGGTTVAIDAFVVENRGSSLTLFYILAGVASLSVLGFLLSWIPGRR